MMTWVQSNSLLLLGVWAGVGLICGAIGEALPAGKAKSVLLAIAHVSPANVVSAVKALRAVAP